LEGKEEGGGSFLLFRKKRAKPRNDLFPTSCLKKDLLINIDPMGPKKAPTVLLQGEVSGKLLLITTTKGEGFDLPSEPAEEFPPPRRGDQEMISPYSGKLTNTGPTHLHRLRT